MSEYGQCLDKLGFRAGKFMDWLFENENGICHVRVSGVLLKDNKIFLQKIKDKNEYDLPGGHLQFGEPLEKALVREYQEESGVTIKCNTNI